ncbi:hypothetical protein R3I93_020719 [Phoxinus phoxinus]|uniref:Uncharacterized protein n=2 Tax=Phoxinus phoxinus TaxID=58324 RepID=A0AAN9GTZ4_9TELE
MPRLRPQPPPQRHPEGIATMRELARQNRIVLKEKSTISRRPQSAELPPIFGSSRARGLCPHPPAQRTMFSSLAEYGIRADQRRAELSRQIRLKCFLRQDRKEAVCIQTQRISQKERAMSERELKADNDWSFFKANLKALDGQKAQEAKQAARYANRTMLKTKEQFAALERKVSEVKIEREEMVFTEPEEDSDLEETCREETCCEELSPTIMWDYMNCMEEIHEEKKIIKTFKDKTEKMKEKVDRSKEEVQKMALLIEQQQEELNKRKYSVRSSKPDNTARKANFRQWCEKMAAVYTECFKCFFSPYFPFVILSEFDDWSFDLLEDMPPETLSKLLNQLFKDNEMCGKEQNQAMLEALREERRQKRLERALAPPVKTNGKKLMPRSPPPKKAVKKEEPVETENQE